MAIEVFNRYEHKYILNEQTYARLQDALEQHMTLDPYNIDRKPYTITNLTIRRTIILSAPRCPTRSIRKS